MEGRVATNLDDNDIDASFPMTSESRDVLRGKLQLANYCRDWTFNPENVLRRLRFLSVPSTAGNELPPETHHAERQRCSQQNVGDISILRLTDPGALENCNHYAAVSYCWHQPKDSSDTETVAQRYDIIDGDRRRMSRVSPNVIRRAIDFATLKGYRLIWIDQESIDQDSIQDKTLHIQAMHLIFRRACDVVAVTNRALANQWQVDMLAIDHYSAADHLFRRTDLDAQDPLSSPDPDMLRQVARLAESLASDLWYTRAWTYQEALLATRAIYLLIPCHPSLQAFSSQTIDHRQLVIRDTDLVSAFDVICKSVRPRQINADLSVDASFSRLSSATRVLASTVPVWKNRPIDVALDCYRLSALDAVRHLIQRNITDDFDLIALCGNLCDYKIRLDPRMVRRSGIGLSMALFALTLLNGDLSLLLAFDSNVCDQVFGQPQIPPSVSMREVVTVSQREELIDWYLESRFACRVSPPTLVSDGLYIRGILWRIDYVDIRIIRRSYIEYLEAIRTNNCPPSILRNIINAVCQHLREQRGLDLTQLTNSVESHGQEHLATQIPSYDLMPVAIPEDRAASGCKLLPGLAYQYAHSVINFEGNYDECLPVSGADRVDYLHTPYRVLIEEETRDGHP